MSWATRPWSARLAVGRGVPASEARQIVDAVRDAGNDAWYLLAMDEGHGFRKKTNRDAMAEAVVLYFQEVMGLELGPEGDGSE